MGYQVRKLVFAGGGTVHRARATCVPEFLAGRAQLLCARGPR
jgi:hypothetical protein